MHGDAQAKFAKGHFAIAAVTCCCHCSYTSWSRDGRTDMGQVADAYAMDAKKSTDWFE